MLVKLAYSNPDGLSLPYRTLVVLLIPISTVDLELHLLSSHTYTLHTITSTVLVVSRATQPRRSAAGTSTTASSKFGPLVQPRAYLSAVAITDPAERFHTPQKQQTHTMSTATAKPVGTPRRDPANKTSSSSPGPAKSTPTRTSKATPNGADGVARNRSVRSGANGAPVSARAAVRKPAAPSTLSSNASQADTSDDDAREEQAAYLQELKDRLQKAETDAEERQKQVEVLNARLDEALKEQATLEERAHEEEEKVESLENVKREITRQHRELEGIYEAERVQAMKEKEETQSREEDLRETIQRLKESLSSKHVQSEGEDDHVSRACESNTCLTAPCAC